MPQVARTCVVLPLVLVLAGAAREAQGQATAPVLLQLRPNAGDTLRLRLDQTIEMSRTTRPAAEENAAADVASLVLLARIAVESADGEGSAVTALTDSVRITSSAGFASSGVLRGAQAMQGTSLRFRVGTDGATHMSAPPR